MKSFFVIVANTQKYDERNPSVMEYQNWDIQSFDHYPQEDEIKKTMEIAVSSPQFSNNRVIRYIKIEKRILPSEYSK